LFISDASNVFLCPLEQALRREMRGAINGIFNEPINRDSHPAVKEIGFLITGRQLNSEDSGDEYTIIDDNHPLRQCGQEKFVLCPLDTKPETPKSTLNALQSPAQKEFLVVLQNLGRIAAVFDDQGHQINQFASSPFMHLGPGNPVTNIIHGYLFFEVLASKTPRMDEALLRDVEKLNGRHDMTKVFEQQVFGEEFIVGPGMMALLDYIAATSLWASLTSNPVIDMRAFYEIRKKQYETLNGEGVSRNFRKELQLTLEQYLDKFPRTMMTKVRKSKASKSPASSVVAFTDAELMNWATGPAGGAKVVIASLARAGEDATAARAGDGSGAGAATDEGGSPQ
jgi:hypothetical protein